ncbi:alpha/beta fold hydrolase [Haliea sp.]
MGAGMEIVDRSVEIEGLSVRYHEAGTGFPLIFIHGGGPGASGWSNFHRNIPELAKTHRVIAVDLPGYGESTKLTLKEPRIAFYSRIVCRLMDALNLPKANFVGNSLGGATSVMTALLEPEKVNKLVLMGPAVSFALTTPFPSEGLKHMMNYYREPGPSFEKMKRFVSVMVADQSLISDEIVKDRFEASVREDILEHPPGPPSAESPFEPLWQDLHKIKHKTLVLWGREDRVIPVDSALIFLSQMPNAQLHIFPQCGHWVQWEKADEFNQLVTLFLGSETK